MNMYTAPQPTSRHLTVRCGRFSLLPSFSFQCAYASSSSKARVRRRHRDEAPTSFSSLFFTARHRISAEIDTAREASIRSRVLRRSCRCKSRGSRNFLIPFPVANRTVQNYFRTRTTFSCAFTLSVPSGREISISNHSFMATPSLWLSLMENTYRNDH